MSTSSSILCSPLLPPEIAIWWSITIGIVITRFVIRVSRTSWRLEAPELIMIIAVLLYTTALTLTNVSSCGYRRLNTRYSLKEVASMGSEKQELWRKYGIISFFAEFCNITAQYLVKACLLIVYHRITRNRRTNLYNKLVAAYTFLGYTMIILLNLSVWCQPIYGYWTLSIIQEKPQCASFTRHHITVLIISVSSDFMMILVPLPMLLKTQFSILRKVLLTGVFGMGIFSMTACLFSRLAMILWHGDSHKNFNKDWPLWMTRELSAAVIIGNMYYLAPLVKLLEGRISKYRAKWKKEVGLRNSPEVAHNSPTKSDLGEIHVEEIHPVQEEERNKKDVGDPA